MTDSQHSMTADHIPLSPSRVIEIQADLAAEVMECEYARGLRDAMEEVKDLERTVLEVLCALTGPDGHIWHGSDGKCTGECKDVRKLIARLEPRP